MALTFHNGFQVKQIFLVDDDEDDQELFITALGEIDNRLICQTATNGYDALDQLSKSKVSPDVIFLDLNMPLMNGQKFLQKIKQEENFKDIPVIIFTTSASTKTVEEVKKLGAREFITKPNSFTELITSIRLALECFTR